MILLIDNFDSFTYNLVDYFKQLGQEVEVIRNNISPDTIHWDKYNGLVLSPGPETPLKANFLMSYIDVAADKMPILGICLGHQAINIHFGGTLKKGVKPMHGKVSEIYQTKKASLLETLPPSFDVVRYHSLVIDSLADSLETIAFSKEDEEIMAFNHKNKPIYGLQFHPESILTDFGLKILDNWLKVSEISV